MGGKKKKKNKAGTDPLWDEDSDDPGTPPGPASHTEGGGGGKKGFANLEGDIEAVLMKEETSELISNGEELVGKDTSDRDHGMTSKDTSDRDHSMTGKDTSDRDHGMTGRDTGDKDHGMTGRDTGDRDHGMTGRDTGDRDHGMTGRDTGDKDHSMTGRDTGDRDHSMTGKDTSDRDHGINSSTTQSSKGGKKSRKKNKKLEADIDDDELEAILKGEVDNSTHVSPPKSKAGTAGKPSTDQTLQTSGPPGDVPHIISESTKDTGASSKPSGEGPSKSSEEGGSKPSGEEASKPSGEGPSKLPGEIADNQDGEVKKKKKKKKKEKEEDKKVPKRPGKGAPLAEIKRLQTALKEEEKRRQEEALRLQQEEEERERKKEEKLRLEKERRDKAKQKEKEKRIRRKLEGKPVTKKEKEDQARIQAQLAALKQQGVYVPEKGATVGEKKKVMYGRRQRGKKSKGEAEVVKDEVVVGEQETVDDTSPQVTSVSSDDAVESWEDIVKEEAPSNNEEANGNKQEESDKQSGSDSEGTESSSDEDTDEVENSANEEDLHLTSFEKVKKRIEARRHRNEVDRSPDNLRSPVVCVLGHVDTGKTKILDKIRKTHVQDGEAGGITQQIGATFVPLDSVREQTKMVKEFASSIVLPGLLIIDTPGHESFSNLRNRGSSLCDIAILVVDIMHGLEPQTLESISILQKGRTPFIVALNKIDRLFDWQRSPTSTIRETIKRQKITTKNQFDERVKLTVTQFAEKSLNVALFWEKVDFREYIPLVPTSAITGDGMGDLIALVISYSQKLLSKKLMLSREVEAVVMEVKVISGLGTTIDVILRNGELNEGDTIVLTGIDGPFVTSIRALLVPQPLRELRVKNVYLSPAKVCAAQGLKVIAKGDLDKVIAGTPLLVATKSDEVDVLKEEATLVMKSALSAIKLQDRGVYVQASTLGSLEALLEFLKQSKIPYCGVNIGPVHKRDVMKASVMLEHDVQWAVILAFDVKVERDAQEMADGSGVKIFSADIIYHLFDAFLNHRKEYRDQKRKEFNSVAVFPCKLRVLPNCIFNTRDPIVMGVIVESGFLKPGTPLTVPSKSFTDIGVVSSLELNHKQVQLARQGSEVCIRVEATGDAPRLYGRHFDYTDTLVSKISRESIDAVKNYFREDMHNSDWQLMIELKKLFEIV